MTWSPACRLLEVEGEAACPAEEKKVGADTPAAPRRKPRTAYSKAHPGRAPLPANLPAHLPRKEVILICEEAPHGTLIGYGIKEELVVKPAEFFVQVLKREKRLIEIAGRGRNREKRGITAKLEALKAKIVSIRSRVLPASQLEQACDYAPGQWEKLMVYARDGQVRAAA